METYPTAAVQLVFGHLLGEEAGPPFSITSACSSNCAVQDAARLACASRAFRRACQRALTRISVSMSELAAAQQLRSRARLPAPVDVRPLVCFVRLAGSSLTEFSLWDISSGSQFCDDGGSALLKTLSEVALNLKTLQLLAPASEVLLHADGGAFSAWRLQEFLHALPASVRRLRILPLASSHSSFRTLTKIAASLPNKLQDVCIGAREIGATDRWFAAPPLASEAESRFTVVKAGANLVVLRLALRGAPETSESYRTLQLLASKCPRLRDLEPVVGDDWGGGSGRAVRRAVGSALQALGGRGIPLARLTLRGVPVTTGWVRDALGADRVCAVHVTHCAGVNAAALRGLTAGGRLVGLEAGLDEVEEVLRDDAGALGGLETLSVVDHGDSDTAGGGGGGGSAALPVHCWAALQHVAFFGNGFASRAQAQARFLAQVAAAAAAAPRLRSLEVSRVAGLDEEAVERLVRAAGPRLRALALRRCGRVVARARATAAWCTRLTAVALWERGESSGGGAGDAAAVRDAALQVARRNAGLRNRARFLLEFEEVAPAPDAPAGDAAVAAAAPPPPRRKRRRLTVGSEDEDA